MIPTHAAGFEDILPELINQALGGSSLDDNQVRLQAVGAFLRGIEVSGLVFPSARSDCMVAYRGDEPTDWRGWNFVMYDQAQPVDTAFIDMGGWETDYPPGITFQAFADAEENLSRWAIEGVRDRNHAVHALRREGAGRGVSGDAMAFNAMEIVEECEESFAHAARAWYNFAGGEAVWFPPYRQYILLSDLRDGRVPVFHPEPAPYRIEHETHTRFRCMFCGRDMIQLADYAAGASFFGAQDHPQERYQRRVWRCRCRWWMIEMGYTAYADDDSAWSLNETIYIQGALRQFDISALQASLELFVADFIGLDTKLPDARALQGALLPRLAEELEIGRAVQQECRDRSRMPSSA
eukprot:TRINITY_DN8120_c0_g1_i22.p1 TRINITY_DN8120_c0_g1~~TRINITY_DN8120_c0_g1_i22.p1  ORF type:complete len:352 (+),score=60.97 TRINITY_DN8120_c0_g1_i22:138-1193(+)